MINGSQVLSAYLDITGSEEIVSKDNGSFVSQDCFDPNNPHHSSGFPFSARWEEEVGPAARTRLLLKILGAGVDCDWYPASGDQIRDFVAGAFEFLRLKARKRSLPVNS
jgi:hypothetical protein